MDHNNAFVTYKSAIKSKRRGVKATLLPTGQLLFLLGFSARNERSAICCT